MDGLQGRVTHKTEGPLNEETVVKFDFAMGDGQDFHAATLKVVEQSVTMKIGDCDIFNVQSMHIVDTNYTDQTSLGFSILQQSYLLKPNSFTN